MNTLRNSQGLKDLQADFVAAVFEGRVGEGRSAEGNDFDSSNNKFSESIKSDGISAGISGARRLQIYHNNIYISLTDALKAVYPVVSQLVGDDFFRYMANEYIKKYPSQSGNLHDFGNKLSLFIESFSPASELIYLGDVASLEWAYHMVFHAADSSSFNPLKLRQINAENYDNLIFKLNPASQLIKSKFPILRIWQSNQNAQDEGDETISLDDSETLLLVIRRELDVEFQTLGSGEYAFLDTLNNGAIFSTACESATQAEPECDVSQILLNHIQTDTIVDLENP